MKREKCVERGQESGGGRGWSQSCHDGLERTPKDLSFSGGMVARREVEIKKNLLYLLNFEPASYVARDFDKGDGGN